MHIEQWEISPRIDKKYRVWIRDGERLFKRDFGARGYAQYRDTSPLKAYSHLDHLDKKRRDRYFKRHKIDYQMGSADSLSKQFLWS